MALHGCPHSNPWNCEHVIVFGKKEIKGVDRVKVVNQLIFKWEDYAAL